MEIDIELFKKNFKVNINTLNELDNSIINRQNDLCKIAPFTGNGKADYIVTDFQNIISGYIMNVCNTEKLKLSKEDLIKKVYCEINCNEQSQEFLDKVINNIFFNQVENTNQLNIVLPKYVTCSTAELKISSFIADVMGNKNLIAEIINNNSENYSYNVIEKIFFNIIQDEATKTKTNKKEYTPLVLYMQSVFLEDIKFLMSNKNLANQHIIELLELYYFNYISQLSFVLNKFLKGDPHEYTKFYYALDGESINKTRLASNSFAYLNRDINTLFSHAILLEILNNNNNNNFTSYYSISKDLKNNIKKDDYYASQIKQVSEIYIRCLKLSKESLNDIKKIEDSKDSKDFKENFTKTEVELRYLFDVIYKQFENSSKKRVNDAYVNQFMHFCKNKKCKKRGPLGFVLNITQNDLIFLTKLSVGHSETKRLTDVFFEFEKRGVYLDKYSKNEVIKFYEKLNIIEKKSDSGDALYVKRIL